MRRPPAPKNTRNGLVWRDGRPRWEPSPASRKVGLSGRDLKDLDGAWLSERGTAIAVCDARALWAGLIREAAVGGVPGDEAGAALRAALETLQAPRDEAGRLRRHLLADLIDAAGALLSGQDAAAGVSLSRAPRTAERLLEAYFAAVDAGQVAIEPSTRRAYKTQSRRFADRFAGRGVGSITRKELMDWYEDLAAELSRSNANQCLGAAAAFLKYAWDREWIAATPAVRLNIQKAPGRRVFWTLAEERAFVAWCDAHGFEDVGDGVIGGLWTGARIVDLTGADLEDLAGEVWRFVPQKTKKSGREAMPSITPAFKARIERRRAAARADTVRGLNATPFLFEVHRQRRHTVDSYYRRFRDAQAAAVAAGAVPDGFIHKRQQDTRDTCITRLWEAGVKPARMWPWTGHAEASIAEILREHYIALRAEGMSELAGQLAAWLEKEEMSL